MRGGVMKLPNIIQGGMGVAISDWNLARTVSMQGQLGVVSGIGNGLLMIARLMDGDEEGHVRRALSHFPFQESVQRILDKYYAPEQTTPKAPYKRAPMWTAKPNKSLVELMIVGGFVEMYLAKEGHTNPVGLNLLEKVQLPTMASLYGAMLAGVDVVIVGAGIPVQIAGILDQLINHQAVSYIIDVEGAEQGDEFRIHLDPQVIFPDIVEKLGRLHRPIFLPIISSVVLAKALIKRSTGEVNGFVIEAPTAGGHNAPPRGPLNLDEGGEPIYGDKDVVDLEKMKKIGLPFWLAGGQDSTESLQKALADGAAGIQVGTAFAFCDESGMDNGIKRRVILKVLNGDIDVFTDPLVSPTGYPFKVVQLEGTMSDSDKRHERDRLCDYGMLRHPYKRPDGKLGYRCSSEPEDQYLKKGGKLEETKGKNCLCNSLCATAGFPQHRKDGYVEQPLVTAGDGLVGIGKYIKSGQDSYSVKDVLDYLTG